MSPRGRVYLHTSVIQIRNVFYIPIPRVFAGGRIDSAHHDNNAKRALYDTLAFEKAIRGALELVNDKNTLVLVTADHSQPLIIAGYASRHNSLFGNYIGRNSTVFSTSGFGGWGGGCVW